MVEWLGDCEFRPANIDVGCHSFNGFREATSEEFRLFLLSIGTSGPNATKPTALDYFLETHPITKRRQQN